MLESSKIVEKLIDIDKWINVESVTDLAQRQTLFRIAAQVSVKNTHGALSNIKITLRISNHDVDMHYSCT